MEQIRNFEWAQNKLSELEAIATIQEDGSNAPRSTGYVSPFENRSQRRERERRERSAAKRNKVKA